MPARKTARYNDKAERILQAAAEALAREGLQGLDMAEVARMIGLRRSSLTYYFANVEDLAAAVLTRTIAEMQDKVRAASRHADLQDRLGALVAGEIETYMRWREGSGPRRQQLGEIRALKAARRKELGHKYRALLDDVASLLDGREASFVGSQQSLLCAHLVLENLFWLPAWLGYYHEWEADSVRDQVVHCLLEGLVAGVLPDCGQAIPVGEPIDRRGASPESYLRVATRMICEHGYRGASIERIASELNVTKGSFYHHISMKDDLVEVCFERSFERLATLQREADNRSESALGAVALAFTSIVRTQFDGQFPFLRSSALPGLESQARAQVIERAQRNIRWFSSRIGTAMRDGEARSGEAFISAQVLYIGANAAFDVSRSPVWRGHVAERDYLAIAMGGIKQHLSRLGEKPS